MRARDPTVAGMTMRCLEVCQFERSISDPPNAVKGDVHVDWVRSTDLAAEKGFLAAEAVLRADVTSWS